MTYKVVFGLGKRLGPTFALDVNSEAVSLLQLDQTKRGIEVVRFATFPSSPNYVREGLVVEAEAVGQIARELFGSAGLKSMRPKPLINVSVPGQSVIIRLLPVPVGMPADELADVVRQEAVLHVPFPLEEANMDWSMMHATERTDADGVTRCDVMLVAIQKSIIDTYWKIANLAGASIGSVGVSALQVLRALSMSGYLQEDGRLSMSVNIRRDGTDISIVKNGMPLFSRSVILGIDTLAESISRSLDVPIQDARGLISQAPLLGGAQADQALAQVAQISRTVLGDITDEVVRSLDYYRSQEGEIVLDQMILSGVGASIPAVDRFMQNRMNLNCVLADTFREIVDSPTAQEARQICCAIAVGTAINPAWLPVNCVDVDLNREGPSGAAAIGEAYVFEEPVDTPWFVPVLAVGGAVLIIILAAWLYLSQFDIPKRQAELERVQGEIDVANGRLKKLPLLTEEKDSLARRKVILENIIEHGKPWSAILQTIGKSTPEGVQVQLLTLNNQDLVAAGCATTFAKVSHFAINLGGAQLTSDANVQMAKRAESNPQIIDFGLKATIRSTDQPTAEAQPAPGSGERSHNGASLPVGSGLANQVR